MTGVNSFERPDEGVVFAQCNDCGYKSTSSADCCISCGSLNTFKDICTVEEWESEN